MKSALAPQNTDASMGSSGLNFTWASMKADEQQGDDLAFGCSPHLWRPGSTAYPTPMPTCYPPSARAEEIAKGRQELMQMLEGLPESTYELSLSDLVESKDALENSKKEMNDAEQPETRSMEMAPQINKPGIYRNGSYSKKGDDTKQFLLNIFVPSSMTSRSQTSSSPIPRKHSRQKSNDSNKQSAKGGAGKNRHHTSLATLLKPPYSSTEPSISPSKVSPKPYSAKVYQHLSHPAMDNSYDSGIAKRHNSHRCSKCFGYIFFFKATCQACGKLYCKNCAKVVFASTAEGQKCRDNCSGQLCSNSYLEAHVNRCLPFWTNHRAKTERKTRYSIREEENELKSF